MNANETNLVNEFVALAGDRFETEAEARTVAMTLTPSALKARVAEMRPAAETEEPLKTLDAEDVEEILEGELPSTWTTLKEATAIVNRARGKGFAAVSERRVRTALRALRAFGDADSRNRRFSNGRRTYWRSLIVD